MYRPGLFATREVTGRKMLSMVGEDAVDPNDADQVTVYLVEHPLITNTQPPVCTAERAG
jgi:hypothetical protein